jgi:hypothetical protein
MPLIDTFMPSYALHQVDHVAVAADPATTWAAVRAVDLYRIRWARALFELRTLPERVLAMLNREPALPAPTARIEDITADTGFLILGEAEGHEVVVGSVGKFWQPQITFAKVTPASFAAFDTPGFGKLAWCLRVDPRDGGGAWITIDLRVSATDSASLTRFRRYWWLIGRFSHAIRGALLRAYAADLGAQLDHRRQLPGDELLPTPDVQRTHAITIEAPPAQVWPWLAQMGCQRAGFYSIDRLDNAGMPSADHIIPTLQHIAVGDVIPARPTGKEGFTVRRVDPGRALVLGVATNTYEMIWAFAVEPIGASATRLVLRVRGAYAVDRPLRNRVTAAAVIAAHEIMERAQLSGLKWRAESQPTAVTP